MNIIIPSSSIYSKEQNIVRDNAISRIDLSIAKGEKVVEDKTPIHDEVLYFNEYTTSEMSVSNSSLNKVNVVEREVASVGYRKAAVYLSHLVHFNETIIEIPTIAVKSKILSIDKDDINDFFLPINISFAKITKYTTPIAGDVAAAVGGVNPSWSINATGDATTEEVSEMPSFTQDIEISYSNLGLTAHLKSDAFTLPQQYSRYFSYTKTGVGKDEKFICTIYFPFETIIERAAGFKEETVSTPPVWVSGTRERYIVKQADISILGKKITLNIKYEAKTIGDGNNPWKVDRSELLQTEYNYENTLKEYKGGKETIKIRCSLTDYYGEDNKKMISARGNDTLPMTFSVGDNIIPYVRNATGSDVPISKYPNGTRKIYSVVGVRKLYNGAAWQEITAQEVLPKDIYYITNNDFGGQTYVIQSTNYTEENGTVTSTATMV